MSVIQAKPFLHYMDLRNHAIGKEDRLNMSKKILDKSKPFPNTVGYKDIDASFKEWVDNKLEISYNGKKLPTMELYSNQRISEFAQNWSHQDKNGNMEMNFKTITRDNNPKKGTIYGDSYNIPKDIYFPLYSTPVLQENGQQAYDVYEMKQPMSIDFTYTLSIITNKFDLLNDFNLIVNNEFKSLQCYIFPQQHPMSMKLNDISDKLEYSIDDRKFYSQSYSILVRAYIITEKDFRVCHVASRFRQVIGIRGDKDNKKENSVIAEYDDRCPEQKDDSQYEYRGITFTMTFGLCNKDVEFVFDLSGSAFVLQTIDTENITEFTMFINEEQIDFNEEVYFLNGDKIRISCKRKDVMKEGNMTIIGYDNNVIIDTEKENNAETVLDDDNPEDINIKIS